MRYVVEQTSGSSRGRRSKVARLIDEHNLYGIGAKMERRWTDGQDRWSLRQLAAYFNKAVLEAVLETAGSQPLDGEGENIYRLLTDEDVSGADRTRARRRLEREGIDADALVDDFVTYQAIRTYLKHYRDAEYAPQRADPLEREIENVQQLRGRVDTVTEGKLEQLRDSGHLSIDEFRLLVDVRVVCENCNNQYEIVDLLEAGGCECTE